MVIPLNRLGGLGSATKTILPGAVGSITKGVEQALQSGAREGASAATGGIRDLAESVMKKLGGRGLAALTKLPRAAGQLGWRRPSPAGGRPAPPSTSFRPGILGPSLTGPGSQAGKVQQWVDKLVSLGGSLQKPDPGLRDDLIRTENMFLRVGNHGQLMNHMLKHLLQNIR